MNRLAGPVARRQDLRMARMRDGDVAAVIAVEHAAYESPWTERVVKDCLRVG